jgi:hypothetical protein
MRAPGSFGQAGFVDEDDYPTLPRRYFFSSVHLLLFFQVRTASPSRCRACRAGRYGLHPILCRVRHTEEAA